MGRESLDKDGGGKICQGGQRKRTYLKAERAKLLLERGGIWENPKG